MNQRSPQNCWQAWVNTLAPCSNSLTVSSGYTNNLLQRVGISSSWKVEDVWEFTSPEMAGSQPPTSGGTQSPTLCHERGWTQRYNLCSKSSHRIRPSPGIHLKLHPCLSASPSVSCFPYSLTSLPWEHFHSKSLPLESVAQFASERTQSKMLGVLFCWTGNLGIHSFIHIHWTPLVLGILRNNHDYAYNIVHALPNTTN